MNVLREKRKKLGLTQEQAAKACGVSRRTYQTYEESEMFNDTFNELVDKLSEMGIVDGGNYLVSIKLIKTVCGELFPKEYPEISCAYLYGSYARGEATVKSDIDILVVLDKPMGMKFYGIAEKLEELLHKEVDLQPYEQLINNASMLKDILTEGIKIYGRKDTTKN